MKPISMKLRLAVVKAGLFRSATLVVCAAIAIASCSPYKASLRPQTRPISAQMVLPEPTVSEKSLRVQEPATGWVTLRFDVDESGDVSDIEIVGASDGRLRETAVELLASWSFEPGTVRGEPANFEDIEFVMTFITEELHTGEVVAGLLIVGLIIATIALGVVITNDLKALEGSW